MTALKDSSSYQLRYIRNRLIVLFDLIVEREPELVRDILDQILDLTRDMWMEERINRGWVKALIKTGSQVVRPVSRRIALRYIHANLSEAIVEAILNEIERIILERQIEGIVRGKSRRLTGEEAVAPPALVQDPTSPEGGSPQPNISQNTQEERRDKFVLHPLVWAGYGFCVGIIATYLAMAPGKFSPKSSLPATSYLASEIMVPRSPGQLV